SRPGSPRRGVRVTKCPPYQRPNSGHGGSDARVHRAAGRLACDPGALKAGPLHSRTDGPTVPSLLPLGFAASAQVRVKVVLTLMSDVAPLATMVCAPGGPCCPPVGIVPRSEERRVGKEGRSVWWAAW